MSFFGAEDREQIGQLANLVCELNSRGHCPATSGNYSLRGLVDTEQIIISESGVDKQCFQTENLIAIDREGKLHPDFLKPGRKSSDETGLHLMIYENSEAGCVLHSHHLNGVLFAELFPKDEVAYLENLELLKGLSRVKTHACKIPLPIFDNSQDISELVQKVKPIFKKHENLYGFLLRGHGLTCWGKDLKEAKRHLEVFEYVFSYYLGRRV